MNSKQNIIRPLHISQEIKQDAHKLAAIDNSLMDLTKEFIHKDVQIIQTETNKISKFAQGINSILQKINFYMDQCTKTITDLQIQVSELDGKIRVYERDVKSNNKESMYRKQIQVNEKTYLEEWQQRIKLAAKIDTKVLAKINIDDRKSKANQIFKWIIVTIYGQPELKYYWPNFKQQIFERDEGRDFKQRLGKINASNAKEQQKVKTADFLKNFADIVQCKQLTKFHSQIQQIRNIAQIFMNCHQIARKIRSLQAAIQKSKQESRERDQQAMRWKARAQALQDRIKTNKQYLSVLNKIQSRFQGKVKQYGDKQSKAKQVIHALTSNDTIIPSYVIEMPHEKRQVCQKCQIF